VHIPFVGRDDCFHKIFLRQIYSYFGGYFVENSVDKAHFTTVETAQANVKFVMKQILSTNV
jgi:hypothetical protein